MRTYLATECTYKAAHKQTPRASDTRAKIHTSKRPDHRTRAYKNTDEQTLRPSGTHAVPIGTNWHQSGTNRHQMAPIRHHSAPIATNPAPIGTNPTRHESGTNRHQSGTNRHQSGTNPAPIHAIGTNQAPKRESGRRACNSPGLFFHCAATAYRARSKHSFSAFWLCFVLSEGFALRLGGCWARPPTPLMSPTAPGAAQRAACMCIRPGVHTPGSSIATMSLGTPPKK